MLRLKVRKSTFLTVCERLVKLDRGCGTISWSNPSSLSWKKRFTDSNGERRTSLAARSAVVRTFTAVWMQGHRAGRRGAGANRRGGARTLSGGVLHSDSYFFTVIRIFSGVVLFSRSSVSAACPEAASDRAFIFGRARAR